MAVSLVRGSAVSAREKTRGKERAKAKARAKVKVKAKVVARVAASRQFLAWGGRFAASTGFTGAG